MPDYLRFLSHWCSCLGGVLDTQWRAWFDTNTTYLLIITKTSSAWGGEYFCWGTIGSFSFNFKKWLLYKLSYNKVFYSIYLFWKKYLHNFISFYMNVYMFNMELVLVVRLLLFEPNISLLSNVTNKMVAF